jgi:putative oxidoreductase
MPQPSSSPPTASGSGNFSFAVSLALLLIRLSLGATFIYHGGQKCFGWFGGSGIEGFSHFLASQHLPVLPSVVWAWMAAGGEFGGGVLVLLGFLARLASIPLIVTMLVAIATVTGGKGFSMLEGGYEVNVAFIAMAAAILLGGPGLVSVDAFVFRRGLWARGPQPLGNPEPRGK